jgi:hypothetical protein
MPVIKYRKPQEACKNCEFFSNKYKHILKAQNILNNRMRVPLHEE